MGVDINWEALAQANALGLKVFHDDEIPSDHPPAEVVSILQTIEHVADSVKFTSSILNKLTAQVLIISAPCHEALLRSMKDPLSWSSHHISIWSEKVFDSTTKAIDFRLTASVMEPLITERCEKMLKMCLNLVPFKK